MGWDSVMNLMETVNPKESVDLPFIQFVRENK